MKLDQSIRNVTTKFMRSSLSRLVICK